MNWLRPASIWGAVMAALVAVTVYAASTIPTPTLPERPRTWPTDTTVPLRPPPYGPSVDV